MITGKFLHFNRGEIDQRALAREDIKRVNESASSMVNFIPSRLGNMQYKPGSEFIGSVDSTYSHRLIPFIAAVDDTALLDFYNDKVEFVVNDVQITVSPVTSPITNGTFAANITGWTDASGGSATTSWHSTGALDLTGDGSSNAVSYQTIATTELNVDHFLRIVVKRAACVIKIGTTGASSFDIFTGTLKPGEHVLNFSPTANITITFENSKKYGSLVDTVSFDTGTSNLVIDTPITSAEMDSMRSVQSGDVIFFSFNGGRNFQVEHRGDKSWSVIDFRSDDGPFEVINTSNITLAPTALSGDTILAASDDFFKSGHVGALFKVSSSGQKVEASVSVDTGAGTSSIRVTGVSSSRAFTIVATGFVGGTLTLQRSADNSTWDDVETYTTNQSKSFNDTFDNSIFYYRLYVKAGDNAALDTLVMSLDYASGSIDGICRVTSFTSTTSVGIQVLSDFGSTNATLNWYEGSWSEARGFPTSVDLVEGRLFFAGDDEIWGSVSDAYFSFDIDILGDSASIHRTIGFGPSDPVKWIRVAGQLILGTAGDEIVLRSSAFGEILTPTTANIRSGSTQGSANVEPVKVDGTIYFVQRSGIKIYSLENSADKDVFFTSDATVLNQTICSAGIHRLAVARQPETRIYTVLNDGSMAVYTVDVIEEVAGWSRLTMSGSIEDVTVLPSSDEDRVYVVVLRDGVRCLEKMAKFKDSEGGNVSETFDSFLRFTSPGLTLTGLTHLEGETVGVWADGQDRGTYTVSSGSITVASSWTNVIVGLPYTADYISNKLSGFDNVSVLNRRKRVVETSLVLMNYWPDSIQIGPTIALLKKLPDIEDGTTLSTSATISDYSEIAFEFDGETEVDPRIYIRATGPCTILALTYGVDGELTKSSS